MKNLLILSAILILLVSGCERPPEAGFYVSSSVVDVHETIYFTNTSSRAEYYRWSFGDGTVSSDMNPVHSYDLPGTYLVTLEAFQGSNEMDQTTQYVDVLAVLDADFFVSSPVVDVYETIHFTNTSSEANFYRWSFGDGTVSSEVSPVHSYDFPGTYLVTLEAFQSSNVVDQTTMYIDVLSTTLDIEVLEYYDQYPVADASIVLYTSQSDWDNQVNTVYGMEWFTNENGIAIMYGLDPIVYWVDILHQNYNNYQLAAEDINNVKTLPLEYHGYNMYTFYVDYVGTTASRKDGRKVDQYKVVKIERKKPGNHAR